MRMPWVVLVATSLSACVADPDGDASPPQCNGGKCDGVETTRVLSCWIVPSAETDPFFQVDTLVCRRQADAIYTVGALNVRDASGNSDGRRLDDMEVNVATTVLRIPRDKYPLQIALDVLPDPTRNLGLPSLKTSTTLVTHETATEAAPYAVTLPVRAGELVVDSTTEGAMTVETDIALAPFTDAQGNTTMHVKKSFSLFPGYRASATVPVGSAPLEATFGEQTITVPGFGHYRFDGIALTRFEARTGDEVTTCAAESFEAPVDPSMPDGATVTQVAVRCTLTASELLRLAGASATITTASGVSLAPTALVAGEPALLANLAPADLPVTVAITGAYAGVGEVELDPTLAGQRYAGSLTLEDGSEARMYLEFQVWPLSLQCGELYCNLTRDGGLLPRAAAHSWAVPLATDLGFVDENTTRIFAIAAAPGETSFAGKGLAVTASGDSPEFAAVLSAGSYKLDRTGLVRLP